MILIADGGSTKCEWVVADTSSATVVRRLFTEGINPFIRTSEDISKLLKEAVIPHICHYNIDHIYFYGAGVTPEKAVLLTPLLREIAPTAHISAKSDMDGAVKGCIGDGSGIVAILGTGSNSVCYKDGEVVNKVASLGYILGDEGSGTHLGKSLVSDIYKGVVPNHIAELFNNQYNLSAPELLERVYRSPQPNRFLASFTHFLAAHIDDLYIYTLVERCFEQFVDRNLSHYPLQQVYAIGSVAFHFKQVLQRVLDRRGYTLIDVTQSPIEGLVRYHSGIASAEEKCLQKSFHKITEECSYYSDLGQMSVGEILHSINHEDHRVADAVQRAIPQIEHLVVQLIPRLKQGGRLFYMGAGTSGRLGVLDASEVPPTFGMPPTVVIGLIAGGDKALRTPVEGAEDDTQQGWRDLEQYNPTPLDTVIGIASSGTTPYVVGVLREACQRGLLTAAIASNRNSPAAEVAHIAIETVVGPEFVTGSSRMKSGTAQKMVCNMITTAAMIGIGRVSGNRMVNMQLSNKKLIDRGTRMLVDELSLPYQQAQNLLLLHGSVQRAIEAVQNLKKEE